MRRRVLTAGGQVRLAALAVLLVASSALAQQVFSPTDASTELEALLNRGHQLERERRWGEALSHYENAIRAFPRQRSLQQRFESARLHYDLGRRYGDRSFRDALDRLSEQKALTLYDEVLLKIQAHYVEVPNWKELIDRGTNGLEVALAEAVFLERNLPNADRQQVEQFRQVLRRELGSQVIYTRKDACHAVSRVAQLAKQRLGVAPAAVVLEYTCGAAGLLDPYSAYLTPDQLSEVYSQIEGNFVGLGVELKTENGALVIVRVIPGSPAQQSGIRGGDRIVAVDGVSTRDLSTDEAANLLHGEADSIVELSVLTPGQAVRQVSVRRERVDVPSIDEAKILDSDYGIGYLKLTCFQKTTVRDLDAALWQLHRAGMRGLVIDLRGNPGGLLITAVEVADKFVDRGIIVSTRGRSLEEDFTYSAHAAGTWQIPLVVLIDQESASAAEIFAGAIRDFHRGTIVGRRSYGKGSVQGIFPLKSSAAGVRLTTAKFYSPNGHPYSRVGVEPDILVHGVAKPIDTRTGSQPPAATQDPMLAAALQAAQQLTAQR